MKKDNEERYEGFLIFAEEDLKSARVLLKEGIFNQVCFHSQQVVEKSLKSFIKSKKRISPKTHSLLELLNICSQYDKKFKTLLNICKFLDKFYVPTRYPDAIVGSLDEELPNKRDAEKALKSAEIVYNFVKKILSSST